MKIKIFIEPLPVEELHTKYCRCEVCEARREATGQ